MRSHTLLSSRSPRLPGKASSRSVWFLSETTRRGADFKQTRNILMDLENWGKRVGVGNNKGYASVDEITGQKGKEKHYSV